MTDPKRQELLELREAVRLALAETEERLITYPATGTERDFQFLINKAVSYREVLRKIDLELNA